MVLLWFTINLQVEQFSVRKSYVCAIFSLDCLFLVLICNNQVQHPGVQELMMTDICNLKAFAAFVRRFDVKFDMLSVLHELEEQACFLSQLSFELCMRVSYNFE